MLGKTVQKYQKSYFFLVMNIKIRLNFPYLNLGGNRGEMWKKKSFFFAWNNRFEKCVPMLPEMIEKKGNLIKSKKG